MTTLVRDQIKFRVRHHRKVKRAIEYMNSREKCFIPVEAINETKNSETAELSAIEKLKYWAIEYNISQRAISALENIDFNWNYVVAL